MIEIFKDILGYEGLYQISDNGRVKSMGGKRRGSCGNTIILKPKSSYGYLSVCLCKNGTRKCVLIHRLVASTFIPNRNNKTEVNHINGVKHDNILSNLEWCTPSENIQHGFKLGLMNTQRGEDSKTSKLTTSKVLSIRKKLNEGVPGFVLASMFNVSSACICKIKYNKTWRHI